MTRNHILPSLAVLALTLNVAVAAADSPPPDPPRVDTSVLERIPIQEGGRKKPFSTFATEAMQGMSGRASLRAADGEAIPAVRAVTDLWLDGGGWRDRPLILVNLHPFKEAVGLPAGRKLFSYSELAGNERLRAMLGEIRALRADDRNAELDRLQEEAVAVGSRVAEFESLIAGRAFAFVPHPTDGGARWLPLDRATTYYPGATGEMIGREFADLRTAYQAGDGDRFLELTKILRDQLAGLDPAHYPDAGLIGLEHFYYGFHPFRVAWILYALAGIVLLVGMGWARRGSYVLGWVLALTGLAAQVFGFACRIAISGRPPVTNMYESVLWVAFGCVLFALIFEAIYRSRHFLLGAVPVAVVSLILADSQPTVLSSAIDPLVPVLRDNFWLTTHVLTITLSYAAFALALGVAHIVLGRVVIGRKPSPALYNYIYRTLQIGVFLLGTGTILGGVWANYSWGRFWDWDPKETWALIAFLSYLVILHGRIAGYWSGFGLAVGSVVAFLSVVMAWYGVNFVLGTGLHSYGFGTGGYGVVLMIVLAELAFTGFAIWRYRVLRKRGRAPAPAETARAIEEEPTPAGG